MKKPVMSTSYPGVLHDVEISTPEDVCEYINACDTFGFEFVLSASWTGDPDGTRWMVYHMIVTDPDVLKVEGVDNTAS